MVELKDILAAPGFVLFFAGLIFVVGFVPFLIVRRIAFEFSEGGKLRRAVTNDLLDAVGEDGRLIQNDSNNYSWRLSRDIYSINLRLYGSPISNGFRVNAERMVVNGIGHWKELSVSGVELPNWQKRILAKALFRWFNTLSY